MNPEKCPMCESAHLIPRKTVEHYNYKGQDFSLENIEYAVCPACHSSILAKAEQRKYLVTMPLQNMKREKSHKA